MEQSEGAWRFWLHLLVLFSLNSRAPRRFLRAPLIPDRVSVI